MNKFVPELPTKYKYTWCGPYSLAIINQMSCDEAIEGVKKSLRRKRQVQGMYPEQLMRVSGGKYFKRKLIMTRIKKRDQPTLRNIFDWLKPKRLYVVELTAHFCVVDTTDNTVCDTWSRAWLPVEEHKHARKFVHAFFEVIR